MRVIALGFALGAAWLQTRAGLPEFRWLWVFPLLVLLAVWLPGRWHWPKRLAWLTLAAGIGFFYAAWRAELRLADDLAPAWQGRDVQLQGRVVGLPELTPRGQRFVFQIEAASAPAGQLPGRIMLSHYRFDEAEPIVAVQGGDCLRLTARLARPHGNVNPGGFDYEAWLLERGIRATGHLVGQPVVATACTDSMRTVLDRSREALRSRLQTALAGQPYAGIAVALAVGDQNAIPDAQWTLFRHTGVTHLMSISGLHVTLFAALAYWLTQFVWRRLPGLALRLPAQKAGVGLGLAAAAAYVALAGFGIPAQRTLYMLAAAAFVRWFDVAASASRVLAVALLAVVAVDPWAALSPGFWLSFGAVAALLFAAQGRLGRPAAWRTWLSAQWAVSLALLPVLLLIFHEISLVSPVANAFAIPLISWLAVPLVLLAAVLPFDWLAGLAHGVIAAVMQGLIWLDAWPQPVWHGAAPNGLILLLALLGAAVLILPRGLPGRWLGLVLMLPSERGGNASPSSVPGRWLGLVLMLPLLFPRLERPVEGELWLEVLDVGQGLAIVARTAGHVLLFDAGPRYASGEDAGSRVVAPYLYAQGIDRVDGLIVSHDDSDHSGGAVSLAASHRPGWALASFAGLPAEWVSPLGQAMLQQVAQARPCISGRSWTWDGVRFEILHPTANHYRNGHYRDNDRGCVLRVTTSHGTALIPADIERLGELSLLERLPQRLRAEVLIAPHHGSGTSSMPEFLAAVQPRWVVIPVGHRNRFGHPKPEVLRRYLDIGTTVLRTDRDGAVSVRLTSAGIDLSKARNLQARYWHEPD